ncbi:MAG: hypothetical protein CL610_19920 [Anaerolineaceae bacterium]|nr:hypothetical protein [Anaerolineaceae bacterium]
MKHELPTIFIGNTTQKQILNPVRGDYVTLLGQAFYRIQNFDTMEPFFMSIVSSTDHWLFIASTGGLSAGRGDAENALFPYYTVDKLTENSENTGHKAILLVTRSGRTSLWEPFSTQHHGCYAVQRNLYKNVPGTTLVFEEINFDLGLTYQYAWRTSEQFGFVKTTWLKNIAKAPCQIELVDGLQNILPANVATATQNTFSCLLDAYKRNELEPDTGLGIFALSSTLTDLAEPSESLLATTVAQLGLPHADYLLSSAQLNRFSAGQGLVPETEVRGQRGAYFVHTTVELAPSENRNWHLMTDVQQDSAAIAQKIGWLQGDRETLVQELETDIATNQSSLWQIVASADGVQFSNNELYSAHHFTNVLFNVMRGGIFTDQYWVQTAEFIDFVAARNRNILRANEDFFTTLPYKIQSFDLQARVAAHGATDLLRLSHTYLPLTFSRRHGDPSRPWNRFAINVKKPDGSVRLDYEGNWRDIFQNWEALAYSYPEFVENMIATFLNATTADGYNPYRITYYGVDWEIPEPDNPWANIGYWSDHQIIYLQRLMEISAKMHPGKLQEYLAQPLFSYANVPYQIKPYVDLLEDPYNTINFDWDLERQIEAHQKVFGTDAKLVFGPNGQVLQVSLAEKLLTLLLAKMANFVPEGGIWMNTQRPEWNDANNALVGKGLSVVTLCYLRRYIDFFREMLSKSTLDSVPLSREVHGFYLQVSNILSRFRGILQGSFDDKQRRIIMDALGAVGSNYRWGYYQSGFSGELTDVSLKEIVGFLNLAQQYVEHSLHANKRNDRLFHAYNILHLENGNASVSHLYEMLEGQVAILSSGLLSAEESLALLQSLRNSSLYQVEQQSYILYPDRNLPAFLQKNCLTRDQIADIKLFQLLLEAQNTSIIVCDVNDTYHFSSHIRNFRDVNRELNDLKEDVRYNELINAEFRKIRALYESTFHHDEFTGRSGTFFAYEGLGSVYWHMVAKLLLAVQETALRFRGDAATDALREHYSDIRQGLGFNKTPDIYGAFPTDPYSHTPKGQGAKQPGMTGLVKENILTRYAELALFVEDGMLVFDELLLNPQELIPTPSEYSFVDVKEQYQHLDLRAGSLVYTICQTPIVLEASSDPSITVHFADGSMHYIQGKVLDDVNSGHIFLRDGRIHHITVRFPSDEKLYASDTGQQGNGRSPVPEGLE